jgi:uncharacterized protein YuzE
MNPQTVKYDEISDTLTITFESGIPATGVELNDHLLLRYNASQHKIISLVFLEYSVWAQTAELGPRSFPLSGLTSLPTSLQADIIEMLKQPPLEDWLQCSTYTVSTTESIPIVSLKPTLLHQSA